MTFTDAFTGTTDQELQDRSGWTQAYAGSNRFVIATSGTELAAKSDSGSSYAVYVCTDQGSADHETEIVFVGPRIVTYPAAVRIVDQTTWVAGRWGGTGSGGYRLYKNVAGTLTEIIGVQGVNTTPFTMRVSAEGEDYKLYEDDVQMGTTQTIADADISTAETSQGMIQDTGSNGGVSEYDDFMAQALGGAAATPKGPLGMPLFRPLRGPM